MTRKVDPTEVRNDEIHRRVAGAIRRDAALVDQASARLARWIAADGQNPRPMLLEWRQVLTMLEPAELAEFLESPTPRAKRLRVSSPFFGLVE